MQSTRLAYSGMTKRVGRVTTDTGVGTNRITGSWAPTNPWRIYKLISRGGIMKTVILDADLAQLYDVITKRRNVRP
jgi:hypothetical protein